MGFKEWLESCDEEEIAWAIKIFKTMKIAYYNGYLKGLL